MSFSKMIESKLEPLKKNFSRLKLVFSCKINSSTCLKEGFFFLFVIGTILTFYS